MIKITNEKFWRIAKTSFILIGVSLSFCLQAQPSQNLRLYYKKVFEAEDYILKGQHDSAALLYRAAFVSKPKPFYTDLYNALRCEARNVNPDIALCKSYYKSLILLGLPQKEALILDLNLDWELFKEVAESTFATVNPQLERLIKADQDVRNHCAQVNNGNIYSGTCLDTIRMVDSLNIGQIKKILNTVDLFDESVVGHSGILDLQVIFIHIKSKGKVFEPQLLAAVHKGTLDARVYADFADIFCDRDKSDESLFGPYGARLLQVFCDEAADVFCSTCKKYVALFSFDRNNTKYLEILDKVDKKRAAIYLDKTVDFNIRIFKLFLLKGYNTKLIPIICGERGEGEGIVSDWLNKYNADIIYYIQDKHDFNTK